MPLGKTVSRSNVPQNAEEAVLKIEASLLVARVLNDKAAFERTLRGLPHFLTVGNVERRGESAGIIQPFIDGADKLDDDAISRCAEPTADSMDPS